MSIGVVFHATATVCSNRGLFIALARSHTLDRSGKSQSQVVTVVQVLGAPLNLAPYILLGSNLCFLTIIANGITM